jgi:hypothetical protein
MRKLIDAELDAVGGGFLNGTALIRTSIPYEFVVAHEGNETIVRDILVGPNFTLQDLAARRSPPRCRQI